MKTYFFLISFCLLLSYTVNGQFSSKPCKHCYVVMNNGDTLKCAIENQEDYSHLNTIRIQLNEDKEIRKVKVKDIQSMKLPGKFYEKVVFGKGDHLLERIEDGYAKLYLDYVFEWVGSNGTDPDRQVEVETQDPEPEKIPVYHILIDGKIYSLSQDRFPIELAEHFSDFMELSYRLWSEELDYRDVKKVVKEYNQWKKEQEKEPLKDR